MYKTCFSLVCYNLKRARDGLFSEPPWTVFSFNFFLMEGDGRQNCGYAQNTKRRKRVRAPSRFLRSVARLVQLT